MANRTNLGEHPSAASVPSNGPCQFRKSTHNKLGNSGVQRALKNGLWGLSPGLSRYGGHWWAWQRKIVDVGTESRNSARPGLVWRCSLDGRVQPGPTFKAPPKGSDCRNGGIGFCPGPSDSGRRLPQRLLRKWMSNAFGVSIVPY